LNTLYSSSTSIEVDEVKKFKAIFFPGGGSDVNPALYGEDNTSSYVDTYSIERDLHEFEIYKEAMNLNKKIVGACRGLQLISVLNGIKLVQDISPRHDNYHPIDILDEDPVLKFVDSVNSVYKVNSMHHQGVLVESVPKEFKVVAKHNDIVEILRIGKNILLFQSHPEISWYKFPRLVEAFINDEI
jgi:putative glutamine amidotransferase